MYSDYSCNTDSFKIRFESDNKCVFNTLNTAIEILKSAKEYMEDNNNTNVETKLFMSCSNSRNYYDSNDAREVDMIARSYKDESNNFYQELYYDVNIHIPM